MKKSLVPISHYLSRFIFWTLVSLGVFYLSFHYYAFIVLWLSSFSIAELFRGMGLGLVKQGIMVLDPQSGERFGIPYSLYSICLNVIFAPALVLATVGVNLKGALRALGAVVLMILLHSLELTSVIAFYLTDPRNTSVHIEASALLVDWIPAVYTFLDKMAYAFFPFVVWLLVCFDYLARVFYTVTTPAGDASNMEG